MSHAEVDKWHVPSKQRAGGPCARAARTCWPARSTAWLDPSLEPKFCNTIATYLQYVFNNTYNLGNSLEPYLSAVIYLAALNGVYLAASDFKWWPRFKRGCNEISRHAFNAPPQNRKNAIFNPILEAMLQKAGNDYVTRLGLLMAHRFCLRAQHYVKTKAVDVDLLCYGSVTHELDRNGKVVSMTYRNRHDKNHPRGSRPMDRTIYCTCHTEWTCLPCYSYEILQFNREYVGMDDNDPIIAHSGGIITYDEWQETVQSLIAEIGLDPSDYGTHSLRAGGTSERDLMGHTPLELKQFGWWESLESVYTYIRLDNPDTPPFLLKRLH